MIPLECLMCHRFPTDEIEIPDWIPFESYYVCPECDDEARSHAEDLAVESALDEMRGL